MIEEIFDWAEGENEKMLKALGPILTNPTYVEYYKDLRPSEASSVIGKKKDKHKFEDNLSSSEGDSIDSDDSDDSDLKDNDESSESTANLNEELSSQSSEDPNESSLP